MDKTKSIKQASILGMIGNVFLLIIKTFVGFMTNSQSMIADAFNSAGDIFSSVMTYIGNKIASQEADDDHNLGHGKAEYIYSLLISLVMIVLSFTVIKSSITNMFNPNNYHYSNWLIVVCIITIITKFCLFLYTNYLYKKFDNILIKANSLDHINDCLLTTLNLVACVLSLYHVRYIDSIIGIVISCWILKSAADIFKESYDILMDKAISEELKNRVYEIIKRYPEVKKVIHFNSTPVGYKYQISFTIYVDGKMSTYDSHFIANSLEKAIDKEIDEIYLTVIHVNPIEEDK
ncbi:MAG: cation diffusion facilitator family transporter [Bacilli bacterium]|nr:cation diffusion facilitator family transporter [Bacilli bacterium]